MLIVVIFSGAYLTVFFLSRK